MTSIVDRLRSPFPSIPAMREAADLIEAQAAQLAAYPADWRTDSSLETWFPLSAEQVKVQAAEIIRIGNNRDMWKCQCERQAAEIARLREKNNRFREAILAVCDVAEPYCASEVAELRAALQEKSNG